MLGHTFSNARNGLTSKQARPFVILALVQLVSSLRCDALRMINLDVPQTALQGDTIQLSCSYSLTDGSSQQMARPEQAQNRQLIKSQRKTKRTPRDDGHFLAATKSELSFVPEEALDKQDVSQIAGGSNLPELLYAIKWYKDEREFFRYLAQDWPHKQVLPLEGLHVDVS